MFIDVTVVEIIFQMRAAMTKVGWRLRGSALNLFPLMHCHIKILCRVQIRVLRGQVNNFGYTGITKTWRSVSYVNKKLELDIAIKSDMPIKLPLLYEACNGGQCCTSSYTIMENLGRCLQNLEETRVKGYPALLPSRSTFGMVHLEMLTYSGKIIKR